MASYNNIDYRIRVAKSVERKMMCYLFQQLSIFYPIKHYTYIGMGSIAFIDFILFHKALGIEKMISIEEEDGDSTRFDFNIPFECVKVIYEKSSEALPKLNIEEQCIVWLDYDEKLDTSKLDDIKLLFNRLPSGSFFCISFNSSVDRVADRYAALAERIDETYFPPALDGDTAVLHKTELRRTYYDIIEKVIDETLTSRNKSGNPVYYKQLLNIEYNDGVDMTTFGWLIYDDKDQSKVDTIMQEHYPSFVSTDHVPFEIVVPKLTYKEMRAIEAMFPNIKSCVNQFGKNKGGFLPNSDIENHYNIYKYFSLFSEVNL